MPLYNLENRKTIRGQKMAAFSEKELRQVLNETFKKNNIGWRKEDILDIAQGESGQQKWFLWDYEIQKCNPISTPI